MFLSLIDRKTLNDIYTADFYIISYFYKYNYRVQNLFSLLTVNSVTSTLLSINYIYFFIILCETVLTCVCRNIVGLGDVSILNLISYNIRVKDSTNMSVLLDKYYRIFPPIKKKIINVIIYFWSNKFLYVSKNNEDIQNGQSYWDIQQYIE